MHVEEWWGREERKARVLWGHQTALLGGLHFSALHWGLISQTIPSSPCTPLFCCNSLSPAPSQADTNPHHRICAGTSPKPSWEPVPSTAQRNETILHLCPRSLAGAGQERVNDAWDSCSLWHTLCCLLAPVSKLVKLVSFVRTKINSHRFSTLS